MPRRRLLDPSFTDDTEVAQLTRDERLFLVGCLRNADDEGRLLGHPAYLKSDIFMYDEDIDLKRMREIRDSTIKKMSSWRPANFWHLKLYQNSGIDYLYFPHWYSMEKPSHPTASKLPEPPNIDTSSGTIREPLPKNTGEAQDIITNPSGEIPEKSQKLSGGAPPQSSQGQSSQGKDRLVKVREVTEDFTKFLASENDLTDYLMTTLNKNIAAGRARVRAAAEPGGDVPEELSPEQEATVRMNWGIVVLKKCWKDGIGEEIPNAIFDGARRALKQYPLEVVAKAFAKGVRYKAGKHKSWKYIQTIIDEEIEKRGR